MTKMHLLKRNLPPHVFSDPGFVLIGEQFYPCHVSEMTAKGARIHLDLPIELPSNFSFQLKRDGKILRSCSLVRQEGREASVSLGKVSY